MGFEVLRTRVQLNEGSEVLREIKITATEAKSFLPCVELADLSHSPSLFSGLPSNLVSLRLSRLLSSTVQQTVLLERAATIA